MRVARIGPVRRRSVWWPLLVLGLCVRVRAASPAAQCNFQPEDSPGSCEVLSYSPCLDLVGPSTNYTHFPNLLGHATQEEASAVLDQTVNITEVLLEPDCNYFVCLLFFPVCSPGKFTQINPCRSFCTCVYDNCLQTLNSVNNWTWFDSLNCNQLPDSGSEICISPNDPCATPPSSTPSGAVSSCSDLTSTTSTSSPTHAPTSQTTVIPHVSTSVSASTPPPTHNSLLPNATDQSNTNCTGRLVPHPDTNFDGIHNCAESCAGALLTADQQSLAQIWIATWSLLCLVFSIVIFLTFLLVCKKIYLSPVTPIYYMAVAYAMISLVYVVSVAVGKGSLICDHDYSNELNETAIAVDGLKFPLCGAVFSLLYYSTLCSWSWWLVLSIQWVLSCWQLSPINLKWQVCSHVVAWGAPMVFLLSALSLGEVSGDAVMGTCWIKHGSELPFLIIPLLVVVVLCSVVIVICFGRIAYVQRHSKLKAGEIMADLQNTKTLMRIGIYSTLYMLAMGALLCSYSYDHWFRPQWEYWHVHCKGSVQNAVCSIAEGPRFSIFLVKFSASVAMGILAIFWIANKESYTGWKRVMCLCCDRSNSGSFNVEANTARQIEKEEGSQGRIQQHSRFHFRESSM